MQNGLESVEIPNIIDTISIPSNLNFVKVISIMVEYFTVW